MLEKMLIGLYCLLVIRWWLIGYYVIFGVNKWNIFLRLKFFCYCVIWIVGIGVLWIWYIWVFWKLFNLMIWWVKCLEIGWMVLFGIVFLGDGWKIKFMWLMFIIVIMKLFKVKCYEIGFLFLKWKRVGSCFVYFLVFWFWMKIICGVI